jgi:bis(5'-nucleosyl)-tetraphosphatase (symmetrical)
MADRTLIVGDIQGCCDELEDLLAAAAFVAGADHLVAVGDLVNRGPRSLDVVRLVRSLGGETVLGNHELYLLDVAAGRRRYEDTLDDVLRAEDLSSILDWLVDRPAPLVLVREGWAVVHAGVPSGFDFDLGAERANAAVVAAWRSPEPLANRVAQLRAAPLARFLTTVRYCNGRGEVSDEERPTEGFRPWFDLRPPGPVIAFGHWARLDPARADRPDLRFLDTGCVYGRELTGWLVEEDQRVSVPARRSYWPPR